MFDVQQPEAILLRIAGAFCSIAVLLVLVIMGYLAWPIIASGQFFYIISGVWQPMAGEFGIFPMLCTSLVLAALALFFSAPVSLGVALVASVLGPPRIRAVLYTIVQVMAAIPTVVYGFVAVFLLVPIMREHLIMGSGLSIVTAAIVLAGLIAPTMITLFYSGLTSIPKQELLALDGMGFTAVQKALYLMIPRAKRALLRGLILGFGRALGDTLISLMLSGNSPIFQGELSQSGRTLTAHIALVMASDFESIEFKSIFACGILLYLLSSFFILTIRRLSASKWQEGR